MQVYGLYLKSDPDKVIRYVGQTSRGLENRLKEHLKASGKKVASRYPVSRWCAKHGEDVGIRELVKCDTSEELDVQEVWWIARLKTHVSTGKGGLNLSEGGRGLRGYSYNRSPTAQGRKLSYEDVLQIKNRIWNGEGYKSIARDFPVNNRTVGDIARGKTWAHVPWPTDIGTRKFYDKNKEQSRKMREASRSQNGRAVPNWSDGSGA